MTSKYLFSDIRTDEGLRLTAYPDPLSPLAVARREGKKPDGLSGAPWTIGFGHIGADVFPGLTWTLAKAEAALAGDMARVWAGLDKALPWWRDLDDLRQDVLCELGFNLGVHKLASFTTFLALVKSGKYGEAADDLLGTAWAGQVGARAKRLAEQMRTGLHA